MCFVLKAQRQRKRNTVLLEALVWPLQPGRCHLCLQKRGKSGASFEENLTIPRSIVLRAEQASESVFVIRPKGSQQVLLSIVRVVGMLYAA
jgi:hypothetical protein